ncbi:MAG: phage tail protein [Betaproteobacteria bacterium]|nr:phage tail protein [Betaproteobacteria bacterium]
MSVYLPNGSKFYIGSTYGADKTFDSISNASEAIASFAADPAIIAGDLFEVTSGWERLNKRVVRAKTVSGAGPYLVTFEGIDTTDTNLFPAGNGAGTVREISAWTEITQVESPETSGGEQQFVNYQPVSDDLEKRLPSYRSAQGLKLTFFDDPALAWVAAVQSASDNNQTLYAVKIELKSGARIFASGYWTLQEMPSMQANTPMKSTIDIAYAGRVTRYAS